MAIITTKAMSSATKERLRSRSPASARYNGVANLSVNPLGDAGDEVEPQRQVDEVHRLHQTDDQEHDHLEPTLGLGLARHALDGGVAGQAVTDGRADRTSSQGEPGSDERPGDGDCVVHSESSLNHCVIAAVAASSMSWPALAAWAWSSSSSPSRAIPK